ncbi:hypothetical protein ACP70R_025600 [Stipagrostis hirtigluma subsp. patula]
MRGGGAYDVAVRGLCLAMAAALMACRCAAQPTGSGCLPELVRLSPCMDYMSGNATTPDAPCCSALSALLRSSPACLCTVLGGTAASLGVAIDGARAPQLPAACKVQAPPASQCNAVGVGAPVPSPAPGATNSGAPGTPSDAGVTPAGAGSKATPTSTTQYSDGHINVPGRTIFVFAVASALALLHRL